MVYGESHSAANSDLKFTIDSVRADDRSAIQNLQTLLREYAEHLIETIGPEHVCLTAYETELKDLPARYAALLLGKIDGQPAGCVLLKAIVTSRRQRACEMKRLWVKPECRAIGLGRALAAKLLEEAEALRFDAMYLDTVPGQMQAAYRLYQDLGFEPVTRYNDNQAAGVEFFRRRL